MNERQEFDARMREKAMQALRLACADLPHLSGLAQAIRLHMDRRVETAAVFASGRLLVNPRFLADLDRGDAAFVMAHELLHLAMRTHDRGAGSDPRLVNIAHDLIINDMLRQELQRSPPACGVTAYGARDVSLEQLVAHLRSQSQRLPRDGWRAGRPSRSRQDRPQTALGRAMEDAGIIEQEPPPPELADLRNRGDVLGRELEREWFPDEPKGEVERNSQGILELAVQATSLSVLLDGVQRDAGWRSHRSGEKTRTIGAIRDQYKAPWESALQRWLDAVVPEPRTYARPSRRAGDRTDVVLPGRRRDTWTLHVVLDTSGSMWPHLPASLGALGFFCQSAGVDQLRILQCDMDITRDEVITVDRLDAYEVTGFSGWEGNSVPDEPGPSSPDLFPLLSEVNEPEPQIQPEPRKRRNRIASAKVVQLTPPSGHRKQRRRKNRTFPYPKFKGDFDSLLFDAEIVDVRELGGPTSTGILYPDSDLSPALRRLAEDPEVEAVIVVTDGEIEYPAEPMPYNLLWILPNETAQERFQPEYGHVLALKPGGDDWDPFPDTLPEF